MVILVSVLGTRQFLLYTTDILKFIRHGTLFLFDVEIKLVHSLEAGLFTSTLAFINKDLETLASGVPSGL